MLSFHTLLSLNQKQKIAIVATLVFFVIGAVLFTFRATGHFSGVKTDTATPRTSTNETPDKTAAGGQAVQPNATTPSTAPKSTPTKGADKTAAGGQAVQPNATTPSTATPAPSPTGTSCPNAQHSPGGSDSYGGCWPYAGNTGKPSGVVLSAWTTYPYLNDAGRVVIDKKTVPYIQAYGNTQVVITNSQVNGQIEINGAATLTIEDSTVAAGDTSSAAIGGVNLTIRRVSITGGQHSVQCESNCLVEDSWLHDQYNPDGQGYHNNAFISNGGTNMTVRHNTLHCTAILNATDGGCTADFSLFGDFDTISYVTLDKNLLMPNSSSISYCAYGGYSPAKPYPVATNIVFTNNIFKRGTNSKCGVYGAITSFQTSAAGNVWSNNKWDDGAVLSP